MEHQFEDTNTRSSSSAQATSPAAETTEEVADPQAPPAFPWFRREEATRLERLTRQAIRLERSFYLFPILWLLAGLAVGILYLITGGSRFLFLMGLLTWQFA